MTKNESYLKLVCWSIKRALHSQTPDTFRAYSFAINHETKRILLRAHFGERPSEDDLEHISVVETEIDADFLDHFEGETDMEVVATGSDLFFLADGIAYSGKASQERSARRSEVGRPVRWLDGGDTLPGSIHGY